MKWYWWLLLLGGAGGAAWYFWPKKSAAASTGGAAAAAAAAEEKAKSDFARDVGRTGGYVMGSGAQTTPFAQSQTLGATGGSSMLGGIWDSWKSSLGF